MQKKIAYMMMAFIVVLSFLIPVERSEAATFPFTDVKQGTYYYEPIQQLYDEQIVTGITATAFKPEQAATRGETAFFIANALGLNTENVKNPGFKDVSTSSKYYKAIAAVANAKIVGGYADGTFRPDRSLTRAEIAVIVSRAFELNVATTVSTKFKDLNVVNPSMRLHISTFVNYGITSGKTATTFAPNDNVKRGELAVFINRTRKTLADDFEIVNVE